MSKIESSASIVLVTGAVGALGSAVVERYWSAGNSVVAADLRDPRPSVRDRDRILPIQMNASDPSSIREGLKRIGERGTVTGHVTRWIHCAGGFRWVKTESFTDEDLAFLIDVNFKSTFLLAREIVPLMRENGHGRIILIGAKATQAPAAGMGLYSASKAAINMLTQSLSEELRGTDVTVNAILPSIIDTEANRKDMPSADFSLWVRPKALADIIFGLTEAGPIGESAPFRGALIPVSGGV